MSLGVRQSPVQGKQTLDISALTSYAVVAPSFADDTGDAISGTVGTAIANVTVPGGGWRARADLRGVGSPGRARVQRHHPRPERHADGGR